MADQPLQANDVGKLLLADVVAMQAANEETAAKVRQMALDTFAKFQESNREMKALLSRAAPG